MMKGGWSRPLTILNTGIVATAWYSRLGYSNHDLRWGCTSRRRTLRWTGTRSCQLQPLGYLRPSRNYQNAYLWCKMTTTRENSGTDKRRLSHVVEERKEITSRRSRWATEAWRESIWKSSWMTWSKKGQGYKYNRRREITMPRKIMQHTTTAK